MESKAQEYYCGTNLHLISHVPQQALHILDVGCAYGNLGATLKQQNPQRNIVGIEYNQNVAEIAKKHLDTVYSFDIEEKNLSLSKYKNYFDCIIFGDVLEHLHNPTAVLTKLKPLLKENGVVLACIPNAQHYSVIQQLLTQNFQYHAAGLLDRTHIHLMTFPNIQKMFLDAAYLPTFLHAVRRESPDSDFMQDLTPAFSRLGVAPERAQFTLSAYQYIFKATHLLPVASATEPVSVICGVNNRLQLDNNLKASPDLLLANQPHSWVEITGANSAAQALANGLAHSPHNWIVLAHQDVYLPSEWFARVQELWHAAETNNQHPIGIAGVAGVAHGADGKKFVRYYLDRDQTLCDPVQEDEHIQTLDELVLVFRRDRFIPELSPELGFHFYGAEACILAKRAGFSAAVLNAPCLHNSSRGKNPDLLKKDASFLQSMQRFFIRYQKELPITTTCANIEPDGRYHIW